MVDGKDDGWWVAFAVGGRQEWMPEAVARVLAADNGRSTL